MGPKEVEWVCTGFTGSGQGPVAGSCEQDSETLGSINDGISWLAESTPTDRWAWLTSNSGH